MNMPNFRPFLPCVLKNVRKSQIWHVSLCPNAAKMRKINRRWPKSNQFFWRWSGYISMSNFRPFKVTRGDSQKLRSGMSFMVLSTDGQTDGRTDGRTVGSWGGWGERGIMNRTIQGIAVCGSQISKLFILKKQPHWIRRVQSKNYVHGSHIVVISYALEKVVLVISLQCCWQMCHMYVPRTHDDHVTTTKQIVP